MTGPGRTLYRNDGGRRSWSTNPGSVTGDEEEPMQRDASVSARSGVEPRAPADALHAPLRAGVRLLQLTAVTILPTAGLPLGAIS